MRTLEHHARIATDLSSLNSRIAALAYSFKEFEPRNAADEALITLMLQQAAALVPAAEALLTIAYDPTPAEPEAP
jgi:seryl-tRNA(Sec) selenium transferase